MQDYLGLTIQLEGVKRNDNFVDYELINEENVIDFHGEVVNHIEQQLR